MWSRLRALPQSVLVGGTVLFMLLIISLLSIWSEYSANRYNKRTVRGIREIIRDSSRYSIMSRQDTNYLLYLLHTTYALAYAKAANTIVGTSDITRITGVDADEFLHMLNDQEQHAIADLVDSYPELMPTGAQAVSTGWLA